MRGPSFARWPFRDSGAAGLSARPRSKNPTEEETSMAFVSKMVRRVREQKGQSMTEYALILAAIAVAAFVAYNALGGAIVTLLGDIQANL